MFWELKFIILEIDYFLWFQLKVEKFGLGVGCTVDGSETRRSPAGMYKTL